ncbi:hypothetical protein FHY56_09365 [Brucella gallinifaecis]|uniref:Uncharacterized protein n=1 Tax=Brucella gallinifaecis TaxID=215590 RepID=A0A502BQN4_9HYPH|nr:hypothetical protein FHY56_09365 [Brucella gallinifaecis]
MGLSFITGIQRGTGQKTGDQRVVDDQDLALQLWLFKGIEGVLRLQICNISVINLRVLCDGCEATNKLSRGHVCQPAQGRFSLCFVSSNPKP